MARATRWHHLNPRTSTKPIKLSEYLAQEARSRVVDDTTLTDDWKAWFDERTGKDDK